MTDLIGESVLLEKEEYDKLKLRAELGECLLDHLLRSYPDDTWYQTTRDTMDECATAFWGSGVMWTIDEEERKMKLEYTPHNMADVEVKIVTKLFEMLEDEGWVPKMVDDGGDDLVPTATWSAALEAIDSAEVSALFLAGGTQLSRVVLILGNGVDVVSDYSCSDPAFEALLERHADWIETLTED